VCGVCEWLCGVCLCVCVCVCVCSAVGLVCVRVVWCGVRVVWCGVRVRLCVCVCVASTRTHLETTLTRQLACPDTENHC
jgi:hypothetical protein